jgi:hypothetical protein
MKTGIVFAIQCCILNLIFSYHILNHILTGSSSKQWHFGLELGDRLA